MPAILRPASRRRRARVRVGVIAALTVALIGQGALTAQAKGLDEYASWDDVVAAQGDLDRQNGLIDEINGQIDSLKQQVADAEVASQQAGAAYDEAQAASTAQQEKLYGLQQQVEAAKTEADAAEKEAGSMVAAMSGRVSSDPTMQLLVNPENADNLLKDLATLSKLGTYSGSVYDQAVASRNTANSLSDQAQVALTEYERLEADAQQKYDIAVQTQLSLQQQRDQAITQEAELQAMLIPLTEHRDVVSADYQEGERLREEERQRIAEQRRQEAAAAAAASGYTVDTSAPSAPASSGGYAAPLGMNAYVSDTFGMRFHPVYGYWKMHTGLDLVVPGGTCGAPIYAATSGTVTYAGWLDGWGNRVDYVSDDGSTVFKNAHIMPGGINVYPGQYVSAGQVIAYAGTTGPSTGCHLHFQIEQWGNLVDPQVWLSARGYNFY